VTHGSFYIARSFEKKKYFQNQPKADASQINCAHSNFGPLENQKYLNVLSKSSFRLNVNEYIEHVLQKNQGDVNSVYVILDLKNGNDRGASFEVNRDKSGAWVLADGTDTLWVTEGGVEVPAGGGGAAVQPAKMSPEYLEKISEKLVQGTYAYTADKWILNHKNEKLKTLFGSARNPFFRKVNQLLLESNDNKIRRVRNIAKSKGFWMWNGSKEHQNDFYWTYSSSNSEIYNEQGAIESNSKSSIDTSPSNEENVKLLGFGNVPIKDWSGAFGLYGCALISDFINLVNIGFYKNDELGFAQYAAENLVGSDWTAPLKLYILFYIFEHKIFHKNCRCNHT